jgi:phage terminase large subunit-like protein
MKLSEPDWELLLDEDRLTEARRSAEKKYASQFNESQRQHLRRRAKNDLFFLCYGALGYDLLSKNLHGHLARWLEATRGYRYRMQLLPRGHYKSTIITVGESVQMGLPNVANVPHVPYSYGPNNKILLAHENRESASRFLFEIAEAFLSKELMLYLFPECVPSKRKQRINKYELDLPRTEHHKEPTYDTIGAGGAAQGRHYYHIKMDDLVGEDARDSPTVMKRVLTWFDNVQSLLTRLKYDGWDLTGTRWSAGDVYAHAEEKFGLDRKVSILNAYSPEQISKIKHGKLVAYIRGAIERGEPIFPEEFTLEDLEVIRASPKVWAAQYANNPQDSELTKFSRDWLRFYNVSGDHLIVFDGEGTRRVDVWSLDRLVMIDPSVGATDDADETGIIITGTDKNLNIYILDVIKARLLPPELVDLILELQVKWSPRLISIEEVAFSSVYKYWLHERTKNSRVSPSIYPYKPGSKRSKQARIEGLTNYFAAGQVYLQQGMHDFLDEYEWFPLGKSQHLLDALAQGPEIWTPGLGEREFQSYRDAEDQILAERSSETGY